MKKLIVFFLSFCVITCVSASDSRTCTYSPASQSTKYHVLCNFFEDGTHQCWMKNGSNVTEKDNKESIENYEGAIKDYYLENNLCPSNLVINGGAGYHILDALEYDEALEVVEQKNSAFSKWYILNKTSDTKIGASTETDTPTTGSTGSSGSSGTSTEPYTMTCTYKQNGVEFHWYLSTTGANDKEGVNYFDINVVSPCSTTDEACLTSMGAIDANGNLTCPKVYYGGNQFVVSLENEDTLKANGFEKSSSAVSENTYPKGNYKEQLDETGSKPRVELDMEFCTHNGVKRALRFMGVILLIARVVVPLLLIFLGAIDFVQAILSANSDIGSAVKNFVIRAIAAVLVYLIIPIARTAVNIVSHGNSFESGFGVCMNCVLKPDACTYEEE